MPLQHVLPDFPFSKWGLEFIGPINPPSSVGKFFILTTTYYFTKWTFLTETVGDLYIKKRAIILHKIHMIE
jgi:hypothetical protein